LARGEDPTLRKAVVDIADAHTEALTGVSDPSPQKERTDELPR
jgi:hypothetical protein